MKLNRLFISEIMCYKISVIIPVYNVEDYLEMCFNSLINQTIGFENLEIIFVDDCSTDNSYSIIKEYQDSYDNVMAFRLETNSGGAGKPRNKGLEFATAEYIMFLDPDDIFTEDACKLLYEEITNEDIDIVSGVHTVDGKTAPPALWLDTITEPDESYAERMKKVNEIINDFNFTFKINSLDDCPTISGNFGVFTKIFKKSLIENYNIRFPEGVPAEDSTFLWNAFLNANGIKFINKFIIVYNIKNYSSISHQTSKKIMIGKLIAYYQMLSLAEEKNKVEIFAHYLLLSKLYYFVRNYFLNSELTTSELLEVFECSHNLFKIVVENNDKINIETAPLFKFIAENDYGFAFEYISKFNK